MATNWEQRICDYCGDTFTIDHKSRRIYCCSSCRDKGKRAKDKETKATPNALLIECGVCGRTFKARDRRTKYCSKECSAQANKKHAVSRYRDRVGRCVVCGATLNGKQIKYCSAACAAAPRFAAYKKEVQGHYLDTTAGADETANADRCECKNKQFCAYSRNIGGGGKGGTNETLYCAYAEITGEVRGGYPDECKHFTTVEDKNRRRNK